MKRNRWAHAAMHGILFLFLFQMLSYFFEALYARALVAIGPGPEILFCLVLLAPAVSLIYRNGIPERALAGRILLVCLWRIALPILGSMSLLVPMIGIVLSFSLFPALVWQERRREPEYGFAPMGTGSILALLLSVLFREINSGLDVSMTWIGQPLGWGLALFAWISAKHIYDAKTASKTDETVAPEHRGSFMQAAVMAVGVFGVFVMLYFAWMNPHVTARWTGMSHIPAMALITVAWCGFAVLIGFPYLRTLIFSPKYLAVWNAVFILAMTLTLYRQQVYLPNDPAVYPVSAPATTALDMVAWGLMLLSFPIILINFVLCLAEIQAIVPCFRALVGAIVLGSFVWMVMIFAQIFTTVYDYIPLIGPYFRDRFWAVCLVAGCLSGLPVLLVRKTTFQAVAATKVSRGGQAIIAFLALAAFTGAWYTAARPTLPTETKKSLTVLTYNIQQGYNKKGFWNFNQQLAVLHKANADIIGLQECDTNRIAGGNTDVVRYFAERLNYYSYYGPTPVTGTFGIALLSRYPIRNPQTFFLHSYGPGPHTSEQTAAIRAEIAVGEKIFTVAVTHLGNAGPLIQQQNILKCLEGAENILLMGDFNFRPNTESYQFTVKHLDDAWLRYGKGNIPGHEVDPANRIDHLFISRTLSVEESLFLTGPESDHPALCTRIAW